MSRRSRSVEVGDGRVEVQLLRIEADEEQRPLYRVRVYGPEGKLLDDSEDLRLGARAIPDSAKALESALSFLSAAAEGYGHWMRTREESDERPLFNEAATEWAYQNDDELQLAAVELQEHIDFGRGLSD